MEMAKKFGLTRLDLINKKRLEQYLVFVKLEAEANPTEENLKEVSDLERIISKLK